MNTDQLLSSIQPIIADCLQMNKNTITDQLSMDNTPNWDSIGLINIITSLEHHLSIEIDLEDAEKMTSIKAILELLNTKYISTP
ncbi:MAG: hypothetical protein CMP21_00880 [Rickettsiales bacterium]|nr:hypothetical protein [Rickettsiales bacterium]|tara:strand:- start:4444 stop:4695 length:252 start_codon:yes stop_codon:yes gene_type:complete